MKDRSTGFWRLDVNGGVMRTALIPLAEAAAEFAESIAAPPAGGRDVLALLARRPGDNAQVRTLAEATGLPWSAVLLDFRVGVEALPNLRRGGSLFSLTRRSREALAGAFPRVVIAAGKRAAPAALWLKAASGGRTKLVHLGRTWAPLDWFDLVITTPQYRLPGRPNVIENRFPLTRPEDFRRSGARADLARLPRPRLLVVIGGDAAPLALTAEAVRQLASSALDRARRSGGALLVATSPRTPRHAVAALRAALAGSPARLSVFGEGPNEYRDFLAAADEAIVTGDSVSMATEAAISGAKVEIFPLPGRFDAGAHMTGALEALCSGRPAARRLFDALAARGVVNPRRDIGACLEGYRLAGLFDGGDAALGCADRELASAAARVRALAGSAGFSGSDPFRPE